MAQQDDTLIPDPTVRHEAPEEGDSVSKGTWQEPKLTFVQPVLIKHGSITQLTAADPGFFGTFIP